MCEHISTTCTKPQTLNPKPHARAVRVWGVGARVQVLYHALTCERVKISLLHTTLGETCTDMGEESVGKGGGGEAYGAWRHHCVEASGARGECITGVGTRLRKCLGLLARLEQACLPVEEEDTCVSYEEEDTCVSPACLPVCVTSASLVDFSLARVQRFFFLANRTRSLRHLFTTSLCNICSCKARADAQHFLSLSSSSYDTHVSSSSTGRQALSRGTHHQNKERVYVRVCM